MPWCSLELIHGTVCHFQAISEALSYILFPFALTFLLPVFMSVIVYEKEEKIRELMKMSGMKMSYYWAVNYCYNYALYLLVVTVFTAVALLVEIRLWTQTSPTVLFVLLFLWGHALVSLAFLLSTFLSKHLTSNLAGYLIVVGGVLASLVFNGTVYYREQPPFIYMMYAPLAFYRAVYIMTDSCRRYKCVELEDVHAEMLSAYAFLVLDTVVSWQRCRVLHLPNCASLCAEWKTPCVATVSQCFGATAAAAFARLFLHDRSTGWLFFTWTGCCRPSSECRSTPCSSSSRSRAAA